MRFSTPEHREEMARIAQHEQEAFLDIAAHDLDPIAAAYHRRLANSWAVTAKEWRDNTTH